jgi:hypothetical protein
MIVGFQVSTARSVTVTVFRDISPRILVDIG